MKAGERKLFTDAEQCGHCSNYTSMEIVARHSEVDPYSEYEREIKSWIEWEIETVYELLKCSACRGIMLQSYSCHSLRLDDDVEPIRLYPSGTKTPQGLPPKFQDAFAVAAKVKTIDANLYSVQLGRILEMIVHDRKAEGCNLHLKLKSLADRGEIPQQLVNMASSLRQLRNIGAHANPDQTLSPAEIPILEALCVAVLEYVYTAPHLLEKVKKSLTLLKAKSSKDNSIY